VCSFLRLNVYGRFLTQYNDTILTGAASTVQVPNASTVYGTYYQATSEYGSFSWPGLPTTLLSGYTPGSGAGDFTMYAAIAMEAGPTVTIGASTMISPTAYTAGAGFATATWVAYSEGQIHSTGYYEYPGFPDSIIVTDAEAHLGCSGTRGVQCHLVTGNK
jgi:hypothetical protein